MVKEWNQTFALFGPALPTIGLTNLPDLPQRDFQHHAPLIMIYPCAIMDRPFVSQRDVKDTDSGCNDTKVAQALLIGIRTPWDVETIMALNIDRLKREIIRDSYKVSIVFVF